VINKKPARRIKGFFRAKHRRTGMFLIVILSALLHLPVHAAEFKLCNSCHKVVLEEMFRPFLHVPFLQKRCGECHIPKKPPAPEEKSDPGSLKNRRKISWLGESVMADGSHGFVLPGEKVRESLLVEVRGSEGHLSRKEIAVPPLGGLADVKDDGRSPAITDVRVLRVERDVFLSATVGWQTDTLTDALVRYGIGDLSQTKQAGNRFGRWQEVVLYDLKPDQTYRFTVVSKDIFGRSQTSESKTFSTARPLMATPPTRTGLPPATGEGVELVSRFQRLGSDYLLELTLEKPASVLIGTGKITRKPKPSDPNTSPTGGDDRHHAGLSSKKAAALDACGGCHQKTATATHPVNVYPKPGMTIPPEYPTLPDGRITCRSCHESHSSEHEYLAIKGGRRELCVGCHKDML
jgi:predicted CXXCH cytochrome family protein